MSRIIIDNISDREDAFALMLVRNVLLKGKICNDGKQHTYISVFTAGDKDFVIESHLNRKSERFLVYNETITNPL